MPHIPTTDLNVSNLRIVELVNPNTPGELIPQFEELSDESLQYVVGGSLGCITTTTTVGGHTVTTKVCGDDIPNNAALSSTEMIGADTSEITRFDP